MACVGADIMAIHIPRTGGRSIGRMLGLARRGQSLDPVVNHESWGHVCGLHGPRPVMLGVWREPADWYASMASSSLACHRDWLWPYLEVVGDDPLDLVAAMVDPDSAGVLVPEGAEGDQHILRPDAGRSLLSSLYVRQFMRPGARGVSLEKLEAHHAAYIGLTHMVSFGQLYEGLRELCPDVGAEVRYREFVEERPSVAGIYDSPKGRAVLDAIERQDGWLLRRFRDMPACLRVS